MTLCTRAVRECLCGNTYISNSSVDGGSQSGVALGPIHFNDSVRFSEPVQYSFESSSFLDVRNLAVLYLSIHNYAGP